MKRTRYYNRTMGVLKNALIRRTALKENKINSPKFEPTIESEAKKNVSDSLLFLMYAEENGNLFI